MPEWQTLTSDELPGRRRRIVELYEVNALDRDWPYTGAGGHGCIVRDTVWSVQLHEDFSAERLADGSYPIVEALTILSTALGWAPGRKFV